MECSERKLVTALAILAIAGIILSMSFRSWIQGYYGDVVVMDISPWKLCHLDCLPCPDRKPSMMCFWIPDWTDTGFGKRAIRPRVLKTLKLIISICLGALAVFV